MVSYSVSTPTGLLDTSFGRNGATEFTPMSAVGLALQPDGKLVSAGFSFALARYNPDGSLDTSFGANGIVRPDFGGSQTPNTLVLQPDGKLVVAGGIFISVSDEDFALVRYHPDGSLDTSFGTGGLVRTDVDGTFGSGGARTLLRQPDGKLVAAGTSDVSVRIDFDIVLVRYLVRGRLGGQGET